MHLSRTGVVEHLQIIIGKCAPYVHKKCTEGANLSPDSTVFDRFTMVCPPVWVIVSSIQVDNLWFQVSLYMLFILFICCWGL